MDGIFSVRAPNAEFKCVLPPIPRNAPLSSEGAARAITKLFDAK